MLRIQDLERELDLLGIDDEITLARDNACFVSAKAYCEQLGITGGDGAIKDGEDREKFEGFLLADPALCEAIQLLSKIQDRNRGEGKKINEGVYKAELTALWLSAISCASTGSPRLFRCEGPANLALYVAKLKEKYQYVEEPVAAVSSAL